MTHEWSKYKLGDSVVKHENVWWCILIGICVLVVTYPVYTSGIFVGDDLCFHLNRIAGIKEGLLAGQFPVRIHAYQLNGYGAPIGIFYPDFFLYIPAVFHLLGTPLVLAYRLFCFLIVLFMAFISWYSFDLLGTLACCKNTRRLGAVAAISYVSYWFIFLDLYKRADLGEALALVFIPLALAAILSVLYGDIGKWPLAVVAVTGVCQSHILSTIFMAIAIAVMCLASRRFILQKARLYAFLKALILTVTINLFLLIPFLYYYFHMKFNVPFVYSDALVSQIAGDSWDRWSVKFFIGVQFLWGAPVTINLVLFLKQWFQSRKAPEKAVPTMTKTMFVTALLLIYASTTAFPWNLVISTPGFGWLQFIQFPWRLMILASPCLAFCGALGFVRFVERSPKALAALFISCVVTCLLNMALFSSFVEFKRQMSPELNVIASSGQVPSYGYPGSDDYFFDGYSFEAIRNAAGNVLSAQDMRSSAQITDYHKQGTTVSFAYSAEKSTDISLPLFEYMGYTAENSRGEALEISSDQNHVMLVQLPEGHDTVTVRYTGLPIFRAGDVISCIGLIVFLLLAYKERRNRKCLS